MVLSCRRRDTRSGTFAAALSVVMERATDLRLDHRPAFPRLRAVPFIRTPASGRSLDGRIRAAERRTRLWARRKVRLSRQARATDPFTGRGRARRQHRTVVQEHAIRVERRHRQRRMGPVHPHARHGDAWRRSSGLVASKLCIARGRRGARCISFRGRQPCSDHRSLYPADRTRIRGAALEPRPVGLSRLLQDAGGSRSRRRATSGAQGPGRRDHVGWPRRVECRDTVRFQVGRRAFSRSAGVHRGHQAARSSRVRLGISVCVDSLDAVRRVGGARLSAHRRGG